MVVTNSIGGPHELRRLSVAPRPGGSTRSLGYLRNRGDPLVRDRMGRPTRARGGHGARRGSALVAPPPAGAPRLVPGTRDRHRPLVATKRLSGLPTASLRPARQRGPGAPRRGSGRLPASPPSPRPPGRPADRAAPP